jgi:hypothetical protein
VKYIVYVNNGKEFMITFPGDRSERQHIQISESLGLESIVAAGMFIEVAGRKIFSGESMTLDIKSRGDIDKELYIEQWRH